MSNPAGLRPDPEGVIPFQGFQNLMPWRVQEIILASSLYDSFILKEDGQLSELVVSEFLELNLRQTPGLTHVASGAQALAEARRRSRSSIVITTPALSDMEATELAARMKREDLPVPVVVLAYDHREMIDFVTRHPESDVERIFLWQGDARILLSIVKYIEDKRNAAHDTSSTGVRVIFVVEDNIRFYSSFLPLIHAELIMQSQRLMGEGVNRAHKLLRMQARPKILLCSTFEEAWAAWTTYREYALGLISDIEFPRDGALSAEAGFDLATKIRHESPDLAILLQSSRTEFAERAAEVGASFIVKNSPTLLAELRRFMVDHFALGDFIFRLADGAEVDRATDLKTLEAKLHTVPVESVVYHGERNHFSNWLMARTEFALARRLRPRLVSDFATHEDLRRNLIEAITEYRREQGEVLIGDFDRRTFDPTTEYFARLGGGSLGGKARGLAFMRHMLHRHQLRRAFPGVKIIVPPAVVLGTDVFDRFLADHGLTDLAIHAADDAEVLAAFHAAPLPAEIVEDLAAFLDKVRDPLAVRSSSLLEDSQYQPFTGVYDTYMLPNNDPDPAVRLEQLTGAIRRVYASTFSSRAKAYLKATPYRLEEEKMAVILQKVVGAFHGSRFYPDFAGVARSYNFYPSPPLAPGDGFAAVGLGLGREVVEGEKCLTFCPRYPQNIIHFSSVEDMLANAQREFWALEMDRSARPADVEELLRETRYGLEAAETDGTLGALASTYSPDNHAVYDGVGRPGVRLVTFAPVLKHGIFPLAGILARLLDIGSQGMGKPVEIEFAVRLSGPPKQPREFGFLQVRPLVLSRETEQLEIDDVPPDRLLCRSAKVLGNGRVDGLYDLIAVDFHRFDRSKSWEAAHQLAQYNADLVSQRRPYLLVGVGRWGSTDPWLGIPVTWDQISGARAIVESGFRDLRVTPSQGSHFFQNLMAFQIGYFTANPEAGEGFVDWEWLAVQPAVRESACVRHLHFEDPMVVKMNGTRHQGIIFKPGQG